jgi:hypothetical protein
LLKDAAAGARDLAAADMTGENALTALLRENGANEMAGVGVMPS